MVTNTPAPTIMVTFSAVACQKPNCRRRSLSEHWGSFTAGSSLVRNGVSRSEKVLLVRFLEGVQPLLRLLRRRLRLVRKRRRWRGWWVDLVVVQLLVII